jgi:hypothetical protein
VNSEDSTNSGIYSSQPRAPAQTLKQTGNPPAPTKKSSLASLKNAFIKAGKSSDAPPLPPLRNPFNRSNASLATAVSAGSRRPSIAASGAPALSSRPTTPAGDARYTRVLSSKPKSHQYARSFQSQSGSVWSEGMSEFGFGARSSSPPPLPPMPEGILGTRLEPPASQGYQEEQIGLDPRTPSDYALHAVFMRFATSAEANIDTFLHEPLVSRSCRFYRRHADSQARTLNHVLQISWDQALIQSLTTFLRLLAKSRRSTRNPSWTR